MKNYLYNEGRSSKNSKYTSGLNAHWNNTNKDFIKISFTNLLNGDDSE